MPEYKKISAGDVKRLAPYFAAPGYRACDYTTGCFYLWSDYFQYRYRVSGGFLIVRGEADGKPFYLCPVGSGDFGAVVEELKAETLSNGLPLVFGAVPADKLESLKTHAAYSETVSKRDWCDYLYRAEELSALSGKKFHGQKNQLNYFEKTYYPEFFPMTGETAREAAEFLKTLGNAGNERETELRYEKAHVLDFLKHWDKLGAIGGLIKIDGKVVAFTAGETKGDTLYVHVEKADRAYRGAYVGIMNRFVKYVSARQSEIEYVNREDDMGMEGLRKAKTDLHPAELIEKPNVVLSDRPLSAAWAKLGGAGEF